MYTELSPSDWKEMNGYLETIRKGSSNGNSEAYVNAVIAARGILKNCRPYEGIGGSKLLREMVMLYREIDGNADRELKPILELANLVDRHPEIFERYSDKKSLVAKIAAALEDLASGRNSTEQTA